VLTPEQIVAGGITEHRPVARFALFSGGNDSAATTHFLWTRGLCDAAVHINTTIGIPETRAFVRAFCTRYGIPLIEKTAPVPYDEIVLEHGFPGPGSHRFMYVRLKERCLDELVRETKRRWNDRVLLLTGVRSSESSRRMGFVQPVVRQKTRVWCAPLLDWTNDDLYAYRKEHDVPESEVAALLHMSGECLCGAFARPGEIGDLEAFYPDTARRIHELEKRVSAAGKHAMWGVRPPRDHGMDALPGFLCAGCVA
jgi:3'-phosphoadenosine 5'-phosphosulfate sulfotransferase (PAPS reductase)/FAD synthetase